jgi:hypothetical protein
MLIPLLGLVVLMTIACALHHGQAALERHVFEKHYND